MSLSDEQFAKLKATATPSPAPTPSPSSGGLSDADFQKLKATPAPTASSPPTAQQLFGGGSNPELAQKANKAAKQVESTVGRALDAQRWGAMSALTGTNDTDEQMTRIRTFMGKTHLFPGEEDYQQMKRIPVIGNFLAGTEDTAIKTVTDPLTYESFGLAPVLKALGVGAKLAEAGNTVLRSDTAVGEAARHVYRATNWGGDVALDRGGQAVDRLHGLANKAESTGYVTEQQMKRAAANTISTLSDQEKVTVGKALNGEIPTPMEMPEHFTAKEKAAYDTLRGLTEKSYGIQLNAFRAAAFNRYAKQLSNDERQELLNHFDAGTEPEVPEPIRKSVPNPNKPKFMEHKPEEGPTTPEAQTGTGENVYSKPLATHVTTQNAEAIARAEKLRDVYDRVQAEVEQNVHHKTDYMPFVHPEKKLPEGQQFTINKTNYFDPRLLPRTEDATVLKPEQLLAGFDAMAKNAGRQQTTGILQRELGKLLDDPKISKLFETQLGGGQDVSKLKNLWLSIVGYPRAAIVGLTPRHGANILDLLANTVPVEHFPGVMKDVTALTAKLMKATPDEYEALTQEGREMGALSGGFRERQAFFPKVPGLNKWSAMNNKLVWAIDEAAKQVYAKLLYATGEAGSALEAGGMAAKRLVDYQNVAPIVKLVRYLSPFGTFRGSIPGAVAGGIVRNPARAALYNRMSGGTMYGGQPKKKQHGFELMNPTADVSRIGDLPNGPGDYIRGSVQGPAAVAGTFFGETVTGNAGRSLQDTISEMRHLPQALEHGKLPQPPKHPYRDDIALEAARYLNYGNPIDLRYLTSWAASGIPEAQEALDLLGLGQFRHKPGSKVERAGTDVLRQVTGVNLK